MTTDQKRVPVISASVERTTLKLSFANGEELTIHASLLSDQIRTDAMMHGLKQKLVDAAAISRNPDTGASATINDKYDAVREIYDRITSPDGTWNKIRGDGSGMAGAGLLVRALVQLSGKTKDAIEQFLATKTKEQKQALMVDPKVAPIIAQLKAVDSKIDTGSMLDDLFGGDGNDDNEALM